MRRAICYCEPATALAGERNTWKFIITGISLPKGAHLRFDLMSKGRSIDWETPSVQVKKGQNVIYGLLNGKVVAAKEIEIPHSIVPQYEFILPQELSTEQSFTVVIGAPKGMESEARTKGTRAQICAQRRRVFGLAIDSNGKGHYDEPELFNLDVRGDKLSTIRVMTPSFISKNKRFDVVVRFEDAHGNLTNNAPEDTLIELSHENLRENLNWKLFVPETGFINLPNLYFNEPGVYTIVLKNTATGDLFYAPPIKCFADIEQSLFWGSLHGESERYDSTEGIDNCLRHFRDERAFSFYGVSPFESQEETSNEEWKQISQNVSDFDENDRFNTFLGMQWQGIPSQEGLRVIVFAKEGKSIMRKKDPKYNTLEKIYNGLHAKDIISIPSFTMGEKMGYNFKAFHPNFERVVEIYNAWGSSECTVKDGNTKPIRSTSKQGVGMSAEGALQKALQRNCRFGFVAGGLDDRGAYADFYESDQEQHSPGLTGIISKEHSRAALFEALYQRSCYATTGPRIIVGLFVAGTGMGCEVSTSEKPGLRINRHLTGYVAGTAKIETVEIIRNGAVFHTIHPATYHCEFTCDDMEPLQKVTLTAPDKKPPFVYYYLRVVQEDGHMAWSSPIWVDDMPVAPGSTKRRPAVKSSPATKELASRAMAKQLLETDGDDEDDDDDYDDLEDTLS
jgi:hypothetical protein